MCCLLPYVLALGIDRRAVLVCSAAAASSFRMLNDVCCVAQDQEFLKKQKTADEVCHECFRYLLISAFAIC